MSLYFNKYPSIGQFRNVVAAVRSSHDFTGYDDVGNPTYAHIKPYPIMTFCATVKIHGTNAAIGFNTAGFWSQSRSRIINTESDNNGFAAYTKLHEHLLRNVAQKLCHKYALNRASTDCVMVYGEWCGEGIQNTVGVAKLPKMFVVFDVCVIKNEVRQWLRRYEINDLVYAYMYEMPNVHTVYRFGYRDVIVDFNNPEASLPVFDEMVRDVEDRCPVAAIFLPTDECLIGEGWVLKDECTRTQFKIKGEKHCRSKTDASSKLKAGVTASPEKIEDIAKLVCAICPPSRLEQGLFWLKNERLLDINDSKNIGEYIKWVSVDVYKEELDIVLNSGFDWRLVAKEIAKTARRHFLNRLL